MVRNRTAPPVGRGAHVMAVDTLFVDRHAAHCREQIARLIEQLKARGLLTGTADRAQLLTLLGRMRHNIEGPPSPGATARHRSR
jgi:hypothetical protein